MRTETAKATSSESRNSTSLSAIGCRPRKKSIQTEVSTTITGGDVGFVGPSRSRASDAAETREIEIELNPAKQPLELFDSSSPYELGQGQNHGVRLRLEAQDPSRFIHQLSGEIERGAHTN